MIYSAPCFLGKKYGLGGTSLRKIISKIFSGIQFLCCVMLCVEVLLVFITVICRNFFSFTPIWGESLTLFLMVWTCMLSASLPVRSNTHITVTLIDYLIGSKGVGVLGWLVDILCIAYAVIIGNAGYRMALKVSNTVLNGIRISKGYLFASVPVAMVFIILAFIEKFMNRIYVTKEEVNKE